LGPNGKVRVRIHPGEGDHLTDTPDQPEGFPAGFVAKLLLTVTPFLLALLIWWLVARFTG
jgi:hypothetical protein